MSGYFKRLRVSWIIETIQIYGYVNREHIEKKFEVSTPQASQDFGDAQAIEPRIVYSKSSKRYEWQP